jgi:hypothetical protein
MAQLCFESLAVHTRVIETFHLIFLLQAINTNFDPCDKIYSFFKLKKIFKKVILGFQKKIKNVLFKKFKFERNFRKILTT